MGPKRKPKQKQQKQKHQLNKRVKMIDTKSRQSNNQSLLHQYFPNICSTKQRVYQNILKKPNGIMKQQKKLSKQLLTQQTLIIKEINNLFHSVFREVDHQMVNEMWGVLMMVRGDGSGRDGLQDAKEKGNCEVNICNQPQVPIVGQQQKIDNIQQSFYSSQSTVTVQCLKQSNKEQQLHHHHLHIKDELQDNKQSNPFFLVNLEQFRYDYNPFRESKSQKVIKSKDIDLQLTFTLNNSSQPLCFSNETKSSDKKEILQQQQQNECENSSLTVTNHGQNQPFLQKDQTIIKIDSQQKIIQSKYQQQSGYDYNLFVTNAQTENNQLSMQNIQFNQNQYQQQTHQTQQQQNNTTIRQKLSLLSQKLKQGIDNIFNLIQKNQHKKQQAIKFKKYVTQLKKEQHSQKQINFFKVNNHNSRQQKHQASDDINVNINNCSSQSQKQLLLQQENDNDELAFEQMNYYFVSNQQYQKQNNINNNNLDILDSILSRKHIENSLIVNKTINDDDDGFFQTQQQTQIYNQNQDLHRIKQIKNTAIFEDQISTNQKSINNDIQTGSGHSSCLLKENNNKENILNQNLQQQAIFQLPQQFLTGYSKQYMNPTFFKRIHQCQLQKKKFIQTIQSTLI